MEKKVFTIQADIYSDDKIQSALEDFQDVAEMNYTWGKLSIQWESEDEIQEIFHEFMNYVLSI